MKAVGFVFQAALPSLRASVEIFPAGSLSQACPVLRWGCFVLCHERLGSLSLFVHYRIFKNAFLWGPGRNFCLLPGKVKCSSSTFPVLSSRILHYTENLGFSCSLKCGICMFVFEKHQVCPLGGCGRAWGGLSAPPEQRHFLNNWAWFMYPVFCGVSLKCQQ